MLTIKIFVLKLIGKKEKKINGVRLIMIEESNLKTNKHEDELKQLGLIKINVRFRYGKNDKDVTVFTFLKKMHTASAVNDLTNKDIKNIIKYIDILTDDDMTNSWNQKEDKVYHLLPISLSKQYGVNEQVSLRLKKESLILAMMNIGTNPFKIKRCLEDESSKSEFKSLTWNQICKDAVFFKKAILGSIFKYNKKTDSWPTYPYETRRDVPLLLLNYIYLIETLKNQNANDEIINLCYKNISDCKYIDDRYDNLMALFFLIKYLENEFGNQENMNLTENLLRQKNKIFVDILTSEQVGDDFSFVKEKLQKQTTDEKSIGLFLRDVNIGDYIYLFLGLYKFLIPKFWEIIDGLPEECIFVFVVEMMREVTLTKQQLGFVKQKIQNENLRLYLEKFNYDLDHKKDKENIIREKTKISWINYLCNKLFLGIWYLLAIIFILAVHGEFVVLLALIFPYFIGHIGFLCFVLMLHFIGFVVFVIKNK